jgi:hypothetical protein
MKQSKFNGAASSVSAFYGLWTLSSAQGPNKFTDEMNLDYEYKGLNSLIWKYNLTSVTRLLGNIKYFVSLNADTL